MNVKQFLKYSLLPVAAILATTATAEGTNYTGEGTYYGYSGGGACSLPVPSNILTAAMNISDFKGSEACGGVVEVTNQDTGLSVTVRIDDMCPGCAPGDVDLADEAFAQIAQLATGRIPISWHYVSNPIANNLKIYFQEGSTQWWSAIQIRDHRYPISTLEYRSTSSGQNFQLIPRAAYNYFIPSGDIGTGPFDFRITDIWGQSMEVASIPLNAGYDIDTGTQFPLLDQEGDNNDGGDNNGGGNEDGGDSGNDDGNSSFSLLTEAENFSNASGVDLETAYDDNGGLNVGWIDTGDWMAYSNIQIPESGEYLVEYRVASEIGGAQISLDLNGGAQILGYTDISATGGWQNWLTVTNTVYIDAGTYSFGIYAQTGGFNLNWWKITKK